jgi:hypothetical protein
LTVTAVSGGRKKGDPRMTTLIVLFKLKSDADREAYEAWARETDIATVRRLENCESFDLYRCGGTLGGHDAPYDYVEVIRLADLAAFREEAQSDTMRGVAAQFREFADNPIFMVTEEVAA